MELVERVTAFFGGPSFSQLRFLTNNAHRQCDQDGGRDENRQDEKEDPAIAPAGIALSHGVILDRKVNGNCHEIVCLASENVFGQIPLPSGEGLMPKKSAEE